MKEAVADAAQSLEEIADDLGAIVKEGGLTTPERVTLLSCRNVATATASILKALIA